MKNLITVTFLKLAFMSSAFAGVGYSEMEHSGMDMPEMDHSSMDSSEMESMGHHSKNYESGSPASTSEALDARVIKIEARDTMRFSVNEITVRKNEPIKFVITNVGRIKHEFTIGTIGELKDHSVEMMDMPAMVHEDPNSVTIPPSGQKEVLWKFSEGSEIRVGCLIPGHYEAGMYLKVNVID